MNFCLSGASHLLKKREKNKLKNRMHKKSTLDPRPSTKSRTHYSDVFYHGAKNKIYNFKSPDVSKKLRMERVPELFSNT